MIEAGDGRGWRGFSGWEELFWEAGMAAPVIVGWRAASSAGWTEGFVIIEASKTGVVLGADVSGGGMGIWAVDSFDS